MTILVPAPVEMGWILMCKIACGGVEWEWSGSDISLVDLCSESEAMGHAHRYTAGPEDGLAQVP